MKKIALLFGLSVFLFVSCKKDYSCTCITTYAITGGETITYTDKFDISEASSKQADLACNEATVIYTEEGYSSETTCTLSK